jgi:simple sugar transport system ATP-binding protein
VPLPLGDNGAGKSTFIKTMSGVHKPTKGEILFEGKPMHFEDPRDAMDGRHRHGAPASRHDPADVGQPQLLHGQRAEKRFGPFKLFDHAYANAITMEEMRKMGINLRGPTRRWARCRAASARPWRLRARCISAPRC